MWNHKSVNCWFRFQRNPFASTQLHERLNSINFILLSLCSCCCCAFYFSFSHSFLFCLCSNTYLSIGSVRSLSYTVANGTPNTRSIICTYPFICAISAWINVAFTPAPSTVTVWLPARFVITLKYKFLRSTAVGIWRIC